MEPARKLATADVRKFDASGSTREQVRKCDAGVCTLFVGKHDQANSAEACVLAHVALAPSTGKGSGHASREFLFVFAVDGRYRDAVEHSAAELPITVRVMTIRLV